MKFFNLVLCYVIVGVMVVQYVLGFCVVVMGVGLSVFWQMEMEQVFVFDFLFVLIDFIKQFLESFNSDFYVSVEYWV